ncbi:hypothetical protein ACNRDB_22435 [Ralstonia pseudosolanacearum]|uniref:hypothetical protein n=1 Tax=Ralstonia pseudosolanacearum TaxID=1310165 RepID=UPI0018D07B3C|nr:hypothetical protein [Ralstonia pseudosolanacearum]
MAFRIRHYPHNDLLSLASHHCESIRTKVANDHLEGITLDCMSCLIALAFAVEALMNFVGSRKVTDWNERAKAPRKVSKIARALGLDIRPEVEPYAAIYTLRIIRNGLAHGKPIHQTAITKSRDDLANAMQAPWAPYCTPEQVEALYVQVRELRRVLFESANIRWGDSLTSAVGSHG